MKKTATLLLCAAACTLYGQHYSFNYKVQDSLKPNLPDFSYYSKNYTSVFGTHQYTLERDKITRLSIYAAPDGNYYSLGDGRYIPNMPIAGNTAAFGNYIGSDLFSGVLSALSGQNFSLEYTIWKKK